MWSFGCSLSTDVALEGRLSLPHIVQSAEEVTYRDELLQPSFSPQVAKQFSFDNTQKEEYD